ncbi:hypothetical protein CHH28_03255 [Bacterioplanes sanyensis]|uniref:NRDE family protein n=1 Tax=Bacterioplanes sanyensis TaxID=1249553 RepID=A0A222FG58_9GAMM|nr:NRDE family protein [Bacterioplanes sanyensis]ASP37750.1 hypothetical protein CHH28_03255 [Bacterioplanes sanyensis]
MCLIVFDWQPSKQLLLAANRDEFYQRPAAAMHIWPEQPSILAGRDLTQGGTWLGINRTGRIAMLTNVRTPDPAPEQPRSRGELVLQFLAGSAEPQDYLAEIDGAHYGHFNFICGDLSQLWYFSNHGGNAATQITAGIHALSNAQLDTPWPKAELAKQQLRDWSSTELPLGLLNRRQPFADEILPNTGVAQTLERQLSAQHIHISDHYGTRCQTAVKLLPQDVWIAEQGFDNLAQVTHQCQWHWSL